MHVRRRILHATQRKCLDGTVRYRRVAIDRARLEEAPGLQIVHQVVGVVRRSVAGGTLAFTEEDFLPAQLLWGGFGWIEVPEQIELGRRWKVEDLLELRH
jgi:hypothetical protein